MIYLPLLLLNELNFRVRDLMVGPVSTHFESSLLVAKECCVTFKGDQQQHGPAAPDGVLRGNLFKDIPVLGAPAWCGLFPATLW